MAGRLITACSTAAIALVASMVLGVPPAVAGGGCHHGPTEGRGDTVTMAGACFTPSVLRVEPGTEVAFINKDAMVHNVSANGWGEFGELVEGDRFTATFRDAGVYPFACMYHPGMVGAIVVGDGTGAGTFDSVTMGASSGEGFSGPAIAEGSSATPASASSSPLGWLGAGAAGVAVGAGIGLLAARRRRTG